MLYEINIAYPVDKPIGIIAEVDEALEALGEVVSSGSGFGVRDLQIVCEGEDKAKAIAAEAEAILVSFSVNDEISLVTYYPVLDEEADADDAEGAITVRMVEEVLEDKAPERLAYLWDLVSIEWVITHLLGWGFGSGEELYEYLTGAGLTTEEAHTVDRLLHKALAGGKGSAGA